MLTIPGGTQIPAFVASLTRYTSGAICSCSKAPYSWGTVPILAGQMHQWKVPPLPYGALPVGKKEPARATSQLQGKASVETCVCCAANKYPFWLLPLQKPVSVKRCWHSFDLGVVHINISSLHSAHWHNASTHDSCLMIKAIAQCGLGRLHSRFSTLHWAVKMSKQKSSREEAAMVNARLKILWLLFFPSPTWSTSRPCFQPCSARGSC